MKCAIFKSISDIIKKNKNEFVAKASKYFISISMQIISDPHKDSATSSNAPGGYEWWYFDAIDESSGYALVVIFYRGNPFSNRYIRKLEDENNQEAGNPKNFPAISISLYKQGEPIYYSFTEYPAQEAEFSLDKPNLKVGNNTLDTDFTDTGIIYTLKLNEDLPSGDRIRAELNYRGYGKISEDFQENDNHGTEGHNWNLVLPKANVEGSINVYREKDLEHTLPFSGRGYHDHNTGKEPMRDEFLDWYWGRYHFSSSTLVYYVMNRQEARQYRGWLIDDDTGKVLQRYKNIELKDKGVSIFGLHLARKLVLENDVSKVVIQQSESLDNGPFYRRFMSEAFLSLEDSIEKSTGFSEYIYPSRIYWRWLWPLVDMRIRYKQEEPHWVQKSGRLYRWTW